MLIQCTKALQKYLKIEPNQKSVQEHSLTAWHGQVKKFNRRNTVILVHDSSLYVVILNGVKAKDLKNFDRLVKKAIADTFCADGFNEQVIWEELLKGDISYTSTKDRKTVASLNQLVQEIEFFIDEADPESLIQAEICKKVNIRLYKSSTGKYVKPIEEMQSILEKKAGQRAFLQPAVQIKVTLRLDTQQVWRRLVVPLNQSFYHLHCILQKAFNWSDSHLHEFQLYREKISFSDFYLPQSDYVLVSNKEAFAYQQGGQIMEFTHQVVIGDALDQFKSIVYTYDLGDDWQHIIKIEKWIEEFDTRYPVCLDGEGATPPENVGGIPGYNDFLDIIQSEDHPDKESILSWAESAGYRSFNKEKVNELLSQWSRI
ncbi:pRiA4b ORF-3-like protein [Gracilibacillus ureilyticus]|uniref:PRiA4b ORF-3-like protein n=1 Tax=Gracilibacillus ureilyticus TaxID=531814 RepID=A0A1H9MK82_9BACI|nr:plasmid pRiA4b ORF-3 family protein [Gracilibacillus ureilyticus]SER23939.1 pRiA4b ORF-3-like protein [Gracilibacillus ureilyticus]